MNRIEILKRIIAGLFVIAFITDLISKYEWRIAIMILASGIVVLILPLSLVMRHRPEQYNDLPEGQGDTTRIETKAIKQPAEINIGVREAIRSSIFWRLELSYIYLSIVINAIVTHVMPYLSSVGISRSSSSLVAMGLPLVSVVGRVGPNCEFATCPNESDNNLVLRVGEIDGEKEEVPLDF